jgi:hypothetical protein
VNVNIGFPLKAESGIVSRSFQKASPLKRGGAFVNLNQCQQLGDISEGHTPRGTGGDRKALAAIAGAEFLRIELFKLLTLNLLNQQTKPKE